MAFYKDWENLVEKKTLNQLKTRVAWTTVPTNDTAGYAKGCIYIKTDAPKWTSGFYVNVWTSEECTFELVTST